MENTVCLIVKVHTPVINQKEDVSLNHGVSLCFVSSYFGYTLKSRTETIMRVPQIITYAVMEKGMEHKGEQS